MTYRHNPEAVGVSLERLKALLATVAAEVPEGIPVRLGAGSALGSSRILADVWNLRLVVEELEAQLEEETDRRVRETDGPHAYNGEAPEVLGLPYRPLDADAWIAAGGKWTPDGTPLVDPASQFEAIAAEVVRRLNDRDLDGVSPLQRRLLSTRALEIARAIEPEGVDPLPIAERIRRFLFGQEADYGRTPGRAYGILGPDDPDHDEPASRWPTAAEVVDGYHDDRETGENARG